MQNLMYQKIFLIKNTILTVSLLSLLFVVNSEATEQKVQIESYDWNGALPNNKVVIVKNPYGSIRSRSNSEKKVFLHASYQKLGDTPLTPEFVIKEVAGNLEIEVKYANNIKDSKGKFRGRTDISVLFPPEIKIIAESTYGMIKIDKSQSDVEAKTTSGKIRLTTGGLFKLQSDSGNISVKLRGMHTQGVSEVSTQRGKIRADIFNDMDIKLMAETEGKGKLTLNSINIKDQKLFRQQGNASSIVNLKSQKGNIDVYIIEPPELVKSVKPTKNKVDLRTLPKSKSWKPGDPVKEVNPKRTDSKKNKLNQ